MIINLLEAGAVLHLVPTDEDTATYNEIWNNLDLELQIFVRPASIIYRPSGASKSRLASGRQSSQSQNQSLIWLHAHASVSITRI